VLKDDGIKLYKDGVLVQDSFCSGTATDKKLGNCIEYLGRGENPTYTIREHQKTGELLFYYFQWGDKHEKRYAFGTVGNIAFKKYTVITEEPKPKVRIIKRVKVTELPQVTEAPKPVRVFKRVKATE
jgi:hypothetical protein